MKTRLFWIGLGLTFLSVPSLRAQVGKAPKEKLLKAGGTVESEAAVARGLNFLGRMQIADGAWLLDDRRLPDPGIKNDVAGTAFGLLPFLGAGFTHKSKNEHAAVVKKG